MKKIVFLIPWLSGYGGTETVIHNLFVEYFKNRYHLPFIFKLYSIGGFIKNVYLRFPNVYVIQLCNNKLLRELIYICILPLLIPYIIIKGHANVVVSTNPILWTISKMFIILFHKNISVVGWYQYSYNAKHVRKFYIDQPDYFLTISADGKKELMNKGVDGSKIKVVYDPVMPSKNVIKHSVNRNKFIYVGRIEYSKQKNISEMFLALSKIRSPWDLYIYGKGSLKEINALKQLSYNLHISKFIHWMGFHKNVFNHIKTADALLLTSNYEGFSMVIAEAMSHGLYVISSDCPNGPSELISPINGNLYEMHDISQLVSLIEDVINGNKLIDHNLIKQSIKELYINEYFQRYINALKCISSKQK